MKRTTILADEELLVEAKHLAVQQGRTLTQLFQDALRDYVQANRPKRRISIIGIGRSKEGDISLRDEEILRAEIDPIEGWSPKREASPTVPDRSAQDA